MKLSDLVKLSTRMFKARTSRTLLTILGMGVGISAILFLVSLGYGLQYVLLENITTSDSLLSLDVAPANSQAPKIDNAFMEQIAGAKDVAEISPISQLSAQINYADLASDVSVLVIEPSFFRLDGTEISKGKEFSEKSNSVVITTALSKIFDKKDIEMLNKEIKIKLNVPDFEKIKTLPRGEDDNSELPTVPLNLDDSFSIIGIVEKEEPLIYLNIRDIESSVSFPFYSRLKVKCLSQEFIEPKKASLVSQGFAVSSLSETIDQANKVFHGIQIVLGSFGVIALTVSAIGMFNTMTVTLLERTEEIGIMKSIGVSDKDVLLLFVCESTIMGFLGGVSGIILGFLGGKIFNLMLNLVAQRFGGQSVEIFQTPLWFMGLIMVLGGIVGFLTGVIPARRASKLDPLDALRYK